MFKALRIVTGILTAFVALTAIGGGVALLMGTEGDRFPLTWLEGTPFSAYTLPALILAVIVGGSALIATVLVFRNHQLSASASIASGIFLAGFVAVEALILKQVPHGPTVIELTYFVIGLAIVGFGAYRRRAEHQPDILLPQQPTR